MIRLIRSRGLGGLGATPSTPDYFYNPANCPSILRIANVAPGDSRYQNAAKWCRSMPQYATAPIDYTPPPPPPVVTPAPSPTPAPVPVPPSSSSSAPPASSSSSSSTTPPAGAVNPPLGAPMNTSQGLPAEVVAALAQMQAQQAAAAAAPPQSVFSSLPSWWPIAAGGLVLAFLLKG